MLISTKGCCYATNKPYEKRMTPKYLREDLNDSLKNLHTDYIDFYWLHQMTLVSQSFLIIEELNKCVDEGKSVILVVLIGKSSEYWKQIPAQRHTVCVHSAQIRSCLIWLSPI